MKSLSSKVLAINLKNTIEISVEGYTPEQLKVKYIGKGAFAGSKGKYTVIFDSSTKVDDTCVLLVYKKASNVVLKRYRFFITAIPKPDADFCGLKYTKDELNTCYMAKNELLKLDSLCFDKTYDKYGVIEEVMRIQDFEIYILAKRTDASVKTSVNSISPEMKSVFNTLKKGDMVMFSIRAKHRDAATPAALNPLVVKIL